MVIGHKMEFEFWQHIEHFPNRSPMDGLLEEIMGELNYMKIGINSIIIIYPRILVSNILVSDLITSADTTAPYSEADCGSLINSFNHLHCKLSSITYLHLFVLTTHESFEELPMCIYTCRHLLW